MGAAARPGGTRGRNGDHLRLPLRGKELMRMRSKTLQLVVVLAACFGGTRIAHADEPPAPGASGATAAPAFTVDVDSDAEGVLSDREAIATELATELGGE